MIKRSLEERFWEKVDVRGPDECWIWQACTNEWGAGLIKIGNRKIRCAYRISWELHFGPIPKGKQVLHNCGNTSCVNPSHLYLGKDLEERFWEKVKITGPDDCWEWQAGLFDVGYGVFHADKETRRAHCVSWEFAYGPIPSDKWVLHRCDNRKCVNPHHLFLGTALDNAQDRKSKGRNGIQYGEYANNARLTNAQVLEIREQYTTQDITQCELAMRWGVSQAEISKIVMGKSWKHLEQKQAKYGNNARRGKRGDRNNQAKLTSSQVLEIRKRYAQGKITQTKLAQQYNVSRSAISAIITRATWSHI